MRFHGGLLLGAAAACLARGGESVGVAALQAVGRSADAVESGGAEVRVRSLAGLIKEVPACATACIEQTTDGHDCPDGKCLCLNSTLEKRASDCVARACSIAEGIQTKNKTQSACDLPARDRSTSFNVTSITLCTITGILVVARLVFKLFYSYLGRFGADDWFIVASVAVGLPCTVINGYGLSRHGLGKDVWTLTPETVELFGRYFYIQQILYLYLVTTIKLSLLLFYLSIFPGRGARVTLWLTGAFTGAFGLTFILISVFQCTPIAFYWRRYVEPLDGHCTEINLLGWIHGGVSVAIDVWMLGIPLWQIRKLELHWKKKVGATIMFMTGAFVTVVSALRLKSLIYFANSLNPTWDEWPVALWSDIEINVGLTCACLPTLRLILVRIWPRAFGSAGGSAAARSASDRSGGGGGISRTTTIRTSFSARKAQVVRLGSVDTHASPVSPRLMEADTTFELDAKYPTWDDRDDEDGGSREERENPFQEGCHAK